MKKNIEPLIIIILTIFIISLSFYPPINNFLKAPKDTTYLGTHNFIFDYSIYLSVITQGQRGNLLAHEIHTSEPHPGSLVHVYYLLSGYLTGPLKIPPYVVYHIMRLTSALIFAASVYWFVCLFTEKKGSRLPLPLQRIALFFLSYASAGFLHITNTPDGTLSPALYFSSWSGFDVVKRSGFLPHGPMQSSFLLLTLGLFIKYEDRPKRKYLILAGIILFVTNLFSPFHSGLAIGSYFLYSLLKMRPDNYKKIIKNLFILLAFFLPSFIYIQYAFSHGVLAWLKTWDASALERIDLKNFSLGLGPIFFLGLAGLLIAVKKRGCKNFFLIFFTAITLVFLFSWKINSLLGINNFKFLGIPLHVFLGILSFYTLSALLSRFKKIFIFILILLFIQSIPTYYISFSQLKDDFKNGIYPYNIFLPSTYYQGILWIKENTDPKKDIVLSKLLSGNLIPALSGNRVYLGHPVSTLNYQQKSETVNQFFENKMDSVQAKKFLSDNSISYIFYSYDEYIPPDLNKYPFLKRVYKNTDVAIYTFSP